MSRLTHLEFDILKTIIESGRSLSQRTLGNVISKSPATVNRTLKDLADKGLYVDGAVTDDGMQLMEGYRVKRAVFIAAGFGSRLVPITLNTPKPLVRVNGVMIIETMLDAVIAAGISEIYVVRGYLADRFDVLLGKYPMIHFIENKDFNESNTISSAMLVKDHLSDAYVLEGDLILKNPSLISRYQYSCNYLGIPVDRTDDWCLEVRNRQITGMKQGGVNTYQMVGLSYWDEKAGKQLAHDIPKVYEMPGGREQFWDDVPLKYCREHYKVELRTCSHDDIIEIDTFRELKAVDSTYGM